MERLLGDSERLMWLIDQVAPFNFIVVARVRGSIEEEALTQALAHVQARHPLLSVRIEMADGKPRFTSRDVPPIPLRVRARADYDAWRDEMERDVAQAIPCSTGPLARALLLQGADSSDLLFSFHHAIGDGTSAAYAMRDLLDALGRILTGASLPAARCPERPPIESLLPEGVRGLRGIARAISLVARITAARHVHRPKTLGCLRVAPVSERAARVVFRKLDRPETSALIDACRQENTTVHGALCAAMLDAVAHRIAGGSLRKPMTISQRSPISMRRQFSPALGDEIGFYVAAANTVHRLDAGTRFWDLARDVRSKITQALAREEPLVAVRLSGKVVPATMTPGALVLKLAEADSYAVVVSNLGQLDVPSDYGPLHLDELQFSFSATAIHSNPYNLVAHTFDGRIFLNFHYTTPHLQPADAASLADEVIGRLLAGSVRARL
ncbi:condensation domain-containing protein [Sorangium sp. So ce426]|uniref:condensation domain-containing protein n=1 Tax=unclassified Sorangium TaxID=2621164 RepID=UPI003F5B339F